jgi:hypothetical protein
MHIFIFRSFASQANTGGIAVKQPPSTPQKFSEQNRASLFTIAHLPKKARAPSAPGRASSGVKLGTGEEIHQWLGQKASSGKANGSEIHLIPLILQPAYRPITVRARVEPVGPKAIPEKG